MKVFVSTRRLPKKIKPCPANDNNFTYKYRNRLLFPLDSVSVKFNGLSIFAIVTADNQANLQEMFEEQQEAVIQAVTQSVFISRRNRIKLGSSDQG